MATELHGSQSPRARAIAERVDTLPLLPSVLIRAIGMDPESDDYFDALVALAGQEPNLAVRLIRFANNAASAPGRPVQTLYQAAMRIGTRECAHIATALAVAHVFRPTTDAQRALWRHSLLVAHIARLIARRGGADRESREQSYLAGLLHDIGRFAMFEIACDDLNKVSESDWHSPETLLATETALLGYDHAELGALVCERWQLPTMLVEVAKEHHAHHLPAHDATGAVGQELRIVRLADAITMRIEADPTIPELDTPEMLAALAPAVSHAELGKYEGVMRYVADHLCPTYREAMRAYDELMADDSALAVH